MTNLPQPRDVEAEALAYARQLLAEYGELLSPKNSRIVSREFLKDYALSHPFNLSSLMHDARAGWEDAHLALVEMIAEFAGSGRLPPPQLASYTIDALNPDLPPRPRGPNKANQVTRNILVVSMVSALLERFEPFGLRAVRNRQAKAPARRSSACALVAKALEDRPGAKLGERAVEAIWENFRGTAFRWFRLFNAAAAGVPKITA
jgi:hypothetical protein